MCRGLVYFQPIRFSRFDNESVNRRCPVLDLDLWCSPKGSRPLGTRMVPTIKTAVILLIIIMIVIIIMMVMIIIIILVFEA